MKLFVTPRAIIEIIVGGCIILGLLGIFSRGSVLIGIMFILIGILGVVILNPRTTIAMFKSIKANNYINKEIKGIEKEN